MKKRKSMTELRKSDPKYFELMEGMDTRMLHPYFRGWQNHWMRQRVKNGAPSLKEEIAKMTFDSTFSALGTPNDSDSTRTAVKQHFDKFFEKLIEEGAVNPVSIEVGPSDFDRERMLNVTITGPRWMLNQLPRFEEQEN